MTCNSGHGLPRRNFADLSSLENPFPIAGGQQQTRESTTTPPSLDHLAKIVEQAIAIASGTLRDIELQEPRNAPGAAPLQ